MVPKKNQFHLRSLTVGQGGGGGGVGAGGGVLVVPCNMAGVKGVAGWPP